MDFRSYPLHCFNHIFPILYGPIRSTQIWCVPNTWSSHLGSALYVVVGIVGIRYGVAGLVRLEVAVELEDLLKNAARWTDNVCFILDRVSPVWGVTRLVVGLSRGMNDVDIVGYCRCGRLLTINPIHALQVHHRKTKTRHRLARLICAIPSFVVSHWAPFMR